MGKRCFLLNNISDFSVIGGDLRQVSVANRLYEQGHNVNVFSLCDTSALNCGITVCTDLDECVCNAHAVILPLPCSQDGELISGTDIKLTGLFCALPSGCIVFGGRITEKIRSLSSAYNFELTDYFGSDAIEIKNAVPTAEGAIGIAMEKTYKTIHGSKCLVLGFGRIGKILSRLLYNMGAKVTAAARKRNDLA